MTLDSTVNLFTKKLVKYDFRVKVPWELPPARSQRFGANSLKFKGSLLWNSHSDEVKTAKSLVILKQKPNLGMALTARATSAETSYWYTLFYLTFSMYIKLLMCFLVFWCAGFN